MSDSPSAAEGAAEKAPKTTWKKMRRSRSRSSLFAVGEPMVWLTGGALVVCAAMVAGLLALVFWKGAVTFWPQSVIRVETPSASDGSTRVYMGEVTRFDDFAPEQNVLDDLPPEIARQATAQLAESGGRAERRLFRTGNFRLTQNHFRWVTDYEIDKEDRPEWVMVLERLEWGRFYGFPEAFLHLSFLPEGNGDGANELIRKLESTSEHEIQLLDRRFEGGRERDVLIPVSELENANDLQAVAEVVAGPEAAWAEFRKHHDSVRDRWHERRDLEKYDTGEVNHEQENTRLAVREAELELERLEEEEGTLSTAYQKAEEKLAAKREEFERIRAWADEEFARIRGDIESINHQNARFQLLMQTAGEGQIAAEQTLIRLDEVVRAYPANQLSITQKVGIYLSRWREFLLDEPREANSEGGVFPAIFGTVSMTLIMSILVVPFGVLAALYLREYAKAGPLVSAVRIAVNNLAGVPSIVFGVFGLGFFCYVVGASIDQLFFAASLPNPTYGTGGLLWASFTLALLTLPVVIVATEEAVSAVPSSMREGSYACGASKWQTIQRIVLPRATPGIITGMILAIARGAGEVAPLMLVGAVKLAPELPIDGLFPYIHPERSFMHLGFHIFDVGFQSQNSEAAKPMVFTTTLLLIAIVATLNFATIWLRNRLRKKFVAGQF
ncbi:MAG: phosphate ABC transporter permease PstA [Acidobacteriota bacterium]